MAGARAGSGRAGAGWRNPRPIPASSTTSPRLRQGVWGAGAGGAGAKRPLRGTPSGAPHRDGGGGVGLGSCTRTSAEIRGPGGQEQDRAPEEQELAGEEEETGGRSRCSPGDRQRTGGEKRQEGRSCRRGEGAEGEGVEGEGA